MSVPATAMHSVTRPLRADADRAARAALRRQIARLESRLGLLTMELWDSAETRALPHIPSAPSSPRLLSLGELEEIRDRLVGRVDGAQRALRDRSHAHSRARARLEAMLADPAAHRHEIVYHAELGTRSCGAYHVLPRLGVLGMLFGWWCVKLSSGCP